MSLSRRILIGLAGGVAVGLFLGDKAAVFDWPAKAFVQLLQVTVLPYIVTSLVSGIARGTPALARRLGSRGGLVILLLWVLSLALVFLSPLGLPPDKGGSYYATTAVSAEPQIDWLDLYIPANPFRSLANNVVPAVVVFSVLLGVALLGLPGKERVLGPLNLLNDTLGRAGNLLVRFTPYGIFAIAGHAAGTLRVEQFGRLQGFLVLSIGLSLILTLWILPGIASALTGLSYRRIVALIWDPLLTAFVTANLFVVLPLLQERAKQLLAEARLADVESGEAVDILVPTSFTFPHGAKILTLAFVLFAGWFAGAPVPVDQYPALAGVGLLSLFGSLNTAIPFLLDLVRLPSDLYQLFVVASVANARFGSAAAAMHTFVLAVIGAHFMAGRLRVDKTKLLIFTGGSVAIVGTFLLASRVVLGAMLPGPEKASETFDRLRVTGAWGRLASVTVTQDATAPAIAPVPGQRLAEIQNRGSLRVCVSPDALPWAYMNGRGEIAGFEVDIAHTLAVGLQVDLVLVQVDRLFARGAATASGVCDMTMGRVIPADAAYVAFSRPLTHEAWAFLVHDYQRTVYSSLDGIQRLPAPRIAVLREPAWIDRLKAMFPNAEVVGVDSIMEFLDAPAGEFDSTFTGFDRASAFSLVYPQFAPVVPAPGMGSVPIAMIVPAGEPALLDFVNAGVEVGRAEGVFAEKLDYWIHGQGTVQERGPRWSIGRNVLGLWKN
jgi:Na+/H+-dicarboxylate symporter/ABC-type amino acid transport substrate-binding protein